MDTVVTTGHPSANATPSPTRNVQAESGAGRAYRQNPNMTPTNRKMTLTRGGLTVPRWDSRDKVENKQGVLGKAGRLTVKVKAANADPRGIGLQGGIEQGIAAEEPAATPAVDWKLIGLAAALVAGAWMMSRAKAGA